jgi:hypothetical protein
MELMPFMFWRYGDVAEYHFFLLVQTWHYCSCSNSRVKLKPLDHTLFGLSFIFRSVATDSLATSHLVYIGILSFGFLPCALPLNPLHHCRTSLLKLGHFS